MFTVTVHCTLQDTHFHGITHPPRPLLRTPSCLSPPPAPPRHSYPFLPSPTPSLTTSLVPLPAPLPPPSPPPHSYPFLPLPTSSLTTSLVPLPAPLPPPPLPPHSYPFLPLSHFLPHHLTHTPSCHSPSPTTSPIMNQLVNSLEEVVQSLNCCQASGIHILRLWPASRGAQFVGCCPPD